MKKNSFILVLLLIMGTLSGCEIKESRLIDFAHDYAAAVNPEDYKQFVSAYQYDMTAECLNPIINEMYGVSNGLSATILEYGYVYDKNNGQFVYYCYRNNNIGFSNDIYILLQLTADRSKIESVDMRTMFSAPFFNYLNEYTTW